MQLRTGLTGFKTHKLVVDYLSKLGLAFTVQLRDMRTSKLVWNALVLNPTKV